MNAPRRLLDPGSNSDPLESALLRAARNEHPPTHMQQRARLRLVKAVGIAAGMSTGLMSTAAAAGLWTKLVVGSAVLMTAGTGAFVAISANTPDEPFSKPVTSTVSSTVSTATSVNTATPNLRNPAPPELSPAITAPPKSAADSALVEHSDSAAAHRPVEAERQAVRDDRNRDSLPTQRGAAKRPEARSTPPPASDARQPADAIAARLAEATTTRAQATFSHMPAPSSGESNDSGSPAETALRRELSLLADARRALQQGEPTRCLQLVRQYRAQYRSGVLAEEAAWLEIQGLFAGGHAGRARERAQAFLTAYPDSPLVPKVQATLVE